MVEIAGTAGVDREPRWPALLADVAGLQKIRAGFRNMDRNVWEPLLQLIIASVKNGTIHSHLLSGLCGRGR